MNGSLCFRIHDVRSGYGGQEILKGITAEIPAGSLIALLGPNGSGKSTLLKALAGLQPYQGSLTIAAPGGEVREARSLTRRQFGTLVGVVPQNFRPAYPFSVWEIIGMGRLPHRSLFAGLGPDDEEFILSAARRVGIEHLLSRNITALSGGEAQRVMLACVLAQDPPVLLLDEPTSALDPNQAARVFALLKELAHEGHTVITVVHDVNTPLAFADGYLALRDGVLSSQGPIEALNGEVLERLYRTPFLAYRSEDGDIMWRALA